MAKTQDRAAAVAAFFVETPPLLLAGGGLFTMENIQAELDRRFTAIGFDEAIRAHAIAQELRHADRCFKRHVRRRSTVPMAVAPKDGASWIALCTLCSADELSCFEIDGDAR